MAVAVRIGVGWMGTSRESMMLLIAGVASDAVRNDEKDCRRPSPALIALSGF